MSGEAARGPSRLHRLHARVIPPNTASYAVMNIEIHLKKKNVLWLKRFLKDRFSAISLYFYRLLTGGCHLDVSSFIYRILCHAVLANYSYFNSLFQ